ncbi:MAG: hypothetical protein MUF21_10030 [Gemmatimonadaceae bacterium]|jgi:hypothetical protein|nr:hypothetical protein [Gemmatimonadaceae bacterium]
MSFHTAASRAHQVRALCQLFVDEDVAPFARWTLRGTGARLMRTGIDAQPCGVRLQWPVSRRAGAALEIDGTGACYATPHHFARYRDRADAPWLPVADEALRASRAGQGHERWLLAIAASVITAACAFVSVAATSPVQVIVGACVAVIGVVMGVSARLAGSDHASIPVTPTPEVAAWLHERLAATYRVARTRVVGTTSMVGD